MPFYEYSCESCGHELEVLQRLSAEPLVDCPACSAAALRKKVSAAAFRLKGTGWYETDFKDSGKPKTEGDDKTDGKKDAKVDGKKEAATSDSTAKRATVRLTGGNRPLPRLRTVARAATSPKGFPAKKDGGSTSASTGTD
ncbi:MAG: hypothetical protein CM1200mP41_33230 [Gammaproteobacteria bacterium]|nr:MAG: hypothetical protein CM1200mP41_33230 [Gammaproteobacteria bacterium]